ncbi:uncharacterized protein LOC115224295 [Argonauta hians]
MLLVDSTFSLVLGCCLLVLVLASTPGATYYEDCRPLVRKREFWVPLNQTVLISCEVGPCSYPFEGVTWLRDGDFINDYTESVSVIRYPDKSKLRILRMNHTYEGEYACMTENAGHTKSVYIHFGDPPESLTTTTTITTTERVNIEPTTSSSGSSVKMTSQMTSLDKTSTPRAPVETGATSQQLTTTTTTSTTSGSSHISTQNSHFWTYLTLCCFILVTFFIKCEQFT